MSNSVNHNEFAFLKGGGSMGELIRNYDWSQTSIGTPDNWPLNLKTMVATVVAARFPMFLWWGNDIIQFYNDAFQPSLGGDEKRNTSLGRKGREAWSDIWSTIGPMIEGIYNGNEATWDEDQLIPIYRNGHYEDVHWTFSYSPVPNPIDGSVDGVLCTCTETTQTVARLKKAEELEKINLSKEEYFKNLTDSVPAVLWLTEPDGSCTYLNRQWYAITGQTREGALGFGWISATHPDDQEEVGKKFDTANREHTSFMATYRLQQEDGSYRWTIDKGSPRFDADGKYLGMIGTVVDVHDQFTLEDAANEAVRASESKFRALIEEAPIATCFFRGTDLTIEVANELILDMWGKDNSVIGLPLVEGVPELKGQPFIDILRNVYETGITFTATNAPAVLQKKDGTKGTFYFDFTYKPLLDEEGKVYGIMDMAVDVTEKALLQKQLEENQKELLSYFEQSPVGIAIITENDLTFTMANPFYGELVGRRPEAIIGKPLLEALPEMKGQGFDQLLRDVIKTGIPFVAKEIGVDILKNGSLQKLYIDLAYQPRRDKDGRVSGVLVVATDVTLNVLSRMKIEESEAQFRSLIQEAPVGTCLYVGETMRVELANEIMLKYWGKDRSVIGLTMLEAMPEMAGQRFPEILQEVYRTGVTHEQKAAAAELVVDGVLQTFYFDFTYKPLRNTNNEVYAILDMAVDVTEQVKSRQELEASETKLRGILQSAPAGIGLFVGRDLIIENPNQTFIDIVGKGADIVGKPLREAMPELITEGQPFLKILDDVYTTGKMFQSYGSQVKIVQNGVMTYNYYNITYSPVYDTNGEVYAILDIAIDVTDHMLDQKRLEDAELALRSAIELAELGTWTYNIGDGLATFSSRLADWYGIDENAQYPGIAPSIETSDKERLDRALAKAISNGAKGEIDIEYRIINAITGQQRIIHLQGQTICNDEGIPVTVRGTTQDMTIQRKHQFALEQEVKLRTEQLAAAVEELQVTNEELEESNSQLIHSNDELAQYAYVASHDLQEPLRKIRVFTSRLTSENIGSADSAKTLKKISAAAERMTLLIQDLLNFSRLLKNDSMYQSVNLSDIVNAVINDFELTIHEKGAEIYVGELPTVQAVGLQMNQLFFNLLSNSLKFIASDVTPVISINSRKISSSEASAYIRRIMPNSSYYDIEVTDNGIGFETQFAEQIFEVFKRLHGREIYPGSGIGLALCRRIAGNHNGVLY
ncbi:MAG: PAS domain-containing protein, partial [Flavitalea sp.]